MKQVLLIGAIYSNNLGDGAICQTMERLLARECHVYLMDIYGRTEIQQFSEIKGDIKRIYIQSVLKIRVRKSILSLGIWPNVVKKKEIIQLVGKQVDMILTEHEIDAIIFAGGALLKGVFLKYIDEILDHNRKHLPVMFNSCGIDTDMTHAEWKRLDAIMKNKDVRWITLRDGYELLSSMYPDKGIKETMDPAVCANRIYKPSETRVGIGIGIMLSHKHSFESQVDFWKQIVKMMDNKGYQWKMFTNGSPEDQGFAAYLVTKLGESVDHLIKRPISPSELYFTISGFKIIVSMRLHSHILAYSSDTPSIAISWDNKINEFFGKIGKKSNCIDFSASTDDVFSIIKAIENDQDYFADKKMVEQKIDKNIDALIEAIG